VPAQDSKRLADQGLGGVAVASPTDAWAISWGGDLIERWDGKQWRVSQRDRDKYDDGSGPTVLTAVAAASPSAAWAVGYHSRVNRRPGGPAHLRSQLIERWDGSRWRFDHVPIIPGHTWLDGVVAVSANDVWAVGTRTVRAGGGFTVDRSLIEHWDGRAWMIVPSPNIGPVTSRPIARGWGRGWEPGSDNRLWAVAAVSAHDIWAVGEHALPVHEPQMQTGFYANVYITRPLALHWNGRRWSIGPFVNTDVNDDGFLTVGEDGFTAVAAAPSGDVLAFEGNYPAGWASHVLWSLSAKTSTRVTYPAPFGPNVLVGAITDITHNDAWILGQPSSGGHIVATQWNGQRWLKTSLPAAGSINAAAANGPDDIWAVGDLNPLPYTNQQVMLHYTC
jgi:hypothetical protein